MVSQEDFSIAEIDWFLVNCYNLAVKVVSAWPASAVFSLFDTAIQVGNYPFCLRTGSDELCHDELSRSQLIRLSFILI